MIEVFRYSTEFGSKRLAGIVLFGNGFPGVRPSAVSLALKVGSPTTGTIRPCLIIPLPLSILKLGRTYCRFTPAFGLSASASVGFLLEPAPERILRHSSFQKKNVFCLSLL